MKDAGWKMKETSPTPGPWKADKFGVITGGIDLCTSVAETYRRKWAATDGGLGTFLSEEDRRRLLCESDANAELIAASPSLLEACKMLSAWCDMCGRTDVAWPATLNEAVIAAQAAIRKAEGTPDEAKASE